MTAQPQSIAAEPPVHVAIVGSGPSGFYAAEALFNSKRPVQVTLIERLPVPFGLVRSGVAPDHPKLKSSVAVFDKIAAHPGLTYIGNVRVGTDVSVQELLDTHHAVILAYGASQDQKLGVNGENLEGSHSATEFVGWYNGHPDYREAKFDLDAESAVVIGQGNVALDVARILLKSVDELRQTDIAEHALEALSKSRIETVHIVGRRGPAQAKFTPAELREFGTLAGCSPVVAPQDLELNEASVVESQDKFSRNIGLNLAILNDYAARFPIERAKRCAFRFYRAPVEVIGAGAVEGVTFAKTRLYGPAFSQGTEDSGEREIINCGLLFRSIGYKGLQLDDVPFNHSRGTLPNTKGRVIAPNGDAHAGLYATGWIKRGPSGVVGTNRADSLETVASLIEDLPILTAANKQGSDALKALLLKRGARTVSYGDWRYLDEVEQKTGALRGKPREKFTRVADMLEVIASSGQAARSAA